MNLLTISVLACWMLSAVFAAIANILAFKFKSSVFQEKDPNWWNPGKSWRNKYKNKMAYQGPKFFASTTFLSFLTDAWHLMQFLSNAFLALSVSLILRAHMGLNLWATGLVFLALILAYGTAYYPLYNRWLRRKPKKHGKGR